MIADDPRTHDDFADRLGSFLLEAFASGVDVEGTWTMASDDPVLSTIRVTITRVDTGPTLSPHRTDASGFADAFEAFLLGEFANGADVEGSWTIHFARSTIPTWDVDIDFSPVEREQLTAGPDD